MTGPDPAKCTTLETQRFVGQTQAVAANTVIAGDAATGEQAVRDCEEDAGDTPTDPVAADSVEVSNIEVDAVRADRLLLAARHARVSEPGRGLSSPPWLVPQNKPIRS